MARMLAPESERMVFSGFQQPIEGDEGPSKPQKAVMGACSRFRKVLKKRQDWD